MGCGGASARRLHAQFGGPHPRWLAGRRRLRSRQPGPACCTASLRACATAGHRSVPLRVLLDRFVAVLMAQSLLQLAQLHNGARWQEHAQL